MRQKLISFGMLLILFLSAGTTSATEYSVGYNETTDLCVDICYSEDGPFKMGDVVKITASFSEPVLSADLTITDIYGIPYPEFMDSSSESVWYCDYMVPGDINGPVDVTVFGVDSEGHMVKETDTDAFVIDNTIPEFTGIKPESAVSTNCVPFNFSAYDELDDDIEYTLYIDDKVAKTGCAVSGEYNEFGIELADGCHTWEIKLKDDAGNVGSSGVVDLYVDTKAPKVTLIAPEDCFVDTMGFLTFNFTAEDAAVCGCEGHSLYYNLYVDGALVEGDGYGVMNSGDYVEVMDGSCLDGVHNWSVSIEDEAGNRVDSEVRDFYVNVLGLDVWLVSPCYEYVLTNDVMFNFSVVGGAGLPFDYKLLINGEEAKCGTFIVGEEPINSYTVTVPVADGDIAWTVNITDCAGNTYEPEPYYFIIDTTAPAPVTNLCVMDAPGYTQWSYTYDYPALHVFWDANTEEDLAPEPYVVFVSDSEPSSFMEMEPVVQTFYTDWYIETFNGKPLVYGKDYWVAVVVLDNLGNYDDCLNVFGPVQTYEDMDITIEAGWNLKSVPKRLLASNACAEAVFGEDSIVIYWNGECWEFPEIIEPCKGYWVYSPEAFVNNIKFKPMSLDSTTPDVPASLDLAPGWQMIGHTSTQPQQWSVTLASLKDILIDYKFSNLITYTPYEGWGGIIPEMGLIDMLIGDGSIPLDGGLLIQDSNPWPVGTLQYEGMMVPGQGYWVFMKQDGTYASVESVYNFQDLYNYQDINGAE